MSQHVYRFGTTMIVHCQFFDSCRTHMSMKVKDLGYRPERAYVAVYALSDVSHRWKKIGVVPLNFFKYMTTPISPIISDAINSAWKRGALPHEVPLPPLTILAVEVLS